MIFSVITLLYFTSMVLVLVTKIDMFFIVFHCTMIAIKVLVYVYLQDYIGFIMLSPLLCLWIYLAKFIHRKNQKLIEPQNQ